MATLNDTECEAVSSDKRVVCRTRRVSREEKVSDVYFTMPQHRFKVSNIYEAFYDVEKASRE